jgi:fibronectin type 3 domain-containing protein
MRTRRFTTVCTAVSVAVLLVLGGVTAAAQQGNTLAIFNLRPTDMAAMGFDGDIVYALTSAMETQDAVALMSRREMEDQLFQKGLVQGDNPDLVLQAGKVLNAEFIVFGQVSKQGATISARLKLMDIGRGSVIKTWTPTFSGREDLLAKTTVVAYEIADMVAGGGKIGSAGATTKTGGAAGATADFIDQLNARLESNQVVLSWDFNTADPINGFNIYRSESADGPYQYAGMTRENRFVDDKIVKGCSYYYRIGVQLSDGTEAKEEDSVQISCVDPEGPAAPLIMKGEAGVRWAEIQFVPSLLNDKRGFSILRYHIYRRSGDQPNSEKVGTVEAGSRSQFKMGLTHRDQEGLDDAVAYAYSVAGVDDKGRESPRSDPMTLTTIGRPDLTVAQDGLLRRVDFKWQPLERVKGYRLYRRAAGEGQWKKVGTIYGANKDRHTDKAGFGGGGLADGTTYEYHLTAYDGRGETGPSTTVTADTKPVPPAPGAFLAQGGLVKSVRISWEPLADPDVGGYAVYRSTDGGTTFDRIAKVKKKGEYLDKGTGFTKLEDGTAYTYTVAAFNLFNAEGARTEALSATTKPRPGPVSALAAALESGRIQVTWDRSPAADIKVQTIARSRNGGYWSEVGKLAHDQTEFADTKLNPGSRYRYRVVATDADGLKSDPVESDEVVVPK